MNVSVSVTSTVLVKWCNWISTAAFVCASLFGLTALYTASYKCMLILYQEFIRLSKRGRIQVYMDLGTLT